MATGLETVLAKIVPCLVVIPGTRKRPSTSTNLGLAKKKKSKGTCSVSDPIWGLYSDGEEKVENKGNKKGGNNSDCKVVE